MNLKYILLLVTWCLASKFTKGSFTYLLFIFVLNLINIISYVDTKINGISNCSICWNPLNAILAPRF